LYPNGQASRVDVSSRSCPIGTMMIGITALQADTIRQFQIHISGTGTFVYLYIIRSKSNFNDILIATDQGTALKLETPKSGAALQKYSLDKISEDDLRCSRP
jgi:hypothetical protein